MKQIAFPYRFDENGQTASADYNDHIRDLIKQVLFTAPGERVNRPDLGSGLLQLVFGPASDEVAASTQYLVQGALQQWLGDLIQVDGAVVEAEESTLRVAVQYTIRRTDEQRSDVFSREIGG